MTLNSRLAAVIPPIQAVQAQVTCNLRCASCNGMSHFVVISCDFAALYCQINALHVSESVP